MYALVNAKTGSMIEGGFFQYRFAEDAAHAAAIEYQADVQVVRQNRAGTPGQVPLYTALYQPGGYVPPGPDRVRFA